MQRTITAADATGPVARPVMRGAGTGNSASAARTGARAHQRLEPPLIGCRESQKTCREIIELILNLFPAACGDCDAVEGRVAENSLGKGKITDGAAGESGEPARSRDRPHPCGYPDPGAVEPGCQSFRFGVRLEHGDIACVEGDQIA